ncbi:ankyrin repeat-containing protein BDA1-like isoform X1 [Trifolium pratense]|uniref:ankyrin repeat-containing protein BDA1-like isoform X1 n=1 Tax=Trifolium pratense TaxID=57577 RepID=UPI001E692629|nr:ankyrin repeat-containing protein BDA1-like isoform X1 [Trifolium pratense]
MNTNNSEQLKAAAEAGNIDLLYEVIKDDPYILERIDLIPFVDTPLHIASSMGHLRFATEIMRLKPSFALKLNEQGFSPIHLAMQNSHKTMVSRFVNINKQLVRVQGREGVTPLHFATQIGDVDLLANFLFLCPESIECLTVRCETALHIAVKNQRYEVLQLLVGLLKTNEQRGAKELQNKILNQEDEAGNTILHISALSTELRHVQELQLLVKTNINLNTKNLENKTALDMAVREEIKNILISAGAKPGSEVTIFPDYQILAYYYKSYTPIIDELLIYISRIRSDISDEKRNTLLIIFTLVVTATYQAAISPAGGVYQANASDDDTAGKSVMPKSIFSGYTCLNILSFLTSMISILILTQRRGFHIFFPMFCFALSYLYSMAYISPTAINYKLVMIFYLSIVSVWMISFVIIPLYSTRFNMHKAMKLNRS